MGRADKFPLLRVSAGGVIPGGKRDITFTVTDTGIGKGDALSQL